MSVHTVDSADIAGLNDEEIAHQRSIYGLNVLPEPAATGVVRVFLRQFRSPFIYILLIAAVVSYYLAQPINAYFIFAVLLLNATIGTIQEYAADRAAHALRKLVPRSAKVVRNEHPMEIDASLLVPGDVVVLVSGDLVPADLRLLSSHGLLIDESLLTGESQPVTKSAAKSSGQKDSRDSICFAGTGVNRGRAVGEVTATADRTEIGQIAEYVGGIDSAKPPLLRRMERFTLVVSYAMIALVTVVFTVTFLRAEDLAPVFLLSVALLVSAIPEGLPAAITVALAIGMRRMARVNVIIRKLAAVESLGSCTYIASDKTGTLTVNELTIQRVVLPGGRIISVRSGRTGERPGFELQSDGDWSAIEAIARTGALANEAVIVQGKKQAYRGDMVDVAFLAFAQSMGLNPEELRRSFPEIGNVPYESENAFSASFNRSDARIRVHVKGALETVLPMCTGAAGVSTFDRDALHRAADALAADGYRILAVAAGDARAHDITAATFDNLEYLGFVGIVDPVRPEAIHALKECEHAQVITAMITGDHPATALAIARELGLATAVDRAVTGSEITAAEQAGVDVLDELVASCRVFARVAPIQKRTIVDRLMRQGHNVAVTGDGVNDAPALHHAHVGIAMGRHGTDVARESSDLILTDDNFASIVNGIREGRIVYNNIRKVIFLLISTGAAEVTLVLWSLFLNLPLPLFPLQLLWLNLVTNGIQDVALAFEPAEGNELKKPPRSPNEPIFDRTMIERVTLSALFMGTSAFYVFYLVLETGATEAEARNITLLLMVLFENVHALNSRSEDHSLFAIPFWSNPLLITGILVAQSIHISAMYVPGISSVLEIQPVSLALWGKLALAASTLIIIDELHKLWLRRATHTTTFRAQV